MKAVIAGATGLVGSQLLEKILADEEFSQVILITRRPLEIQNGKVRQILISQLADLPRYQTELGGDIYFCCLGTTIKEAGSKENFMAVDYQAVLDFARIASFHHAKSFVVISSAGANVNSSIFYSSVKGKTEEGLRQLGLGNLIIFRPSLLIGERKSFRLGEKVASEVFKLVAPLLPESFRKSLMTRVGDLASAMLAKAKSNFTGTILVGPKEI